ILVHPHCLGLEELPNAVHERSRVSEILNQRRLIQCELSLLFTHLAHGLALTTGSALGSSPPSTPECLTAFLLPNTAGLTAGARAWSKHSHRSLPPPSTDPSSTSAAAEKAKRKLSAGWWGITSGSVTAINEKALALFWKVMRTATWRNLHWLPHQVLVYEVRVQEGYGMRWSQDRSEKEGDGERKEERAWIFRGFLEPTMENGHELKWRH
ncbi:hypothetical protein B0H34DRAFT_642847, partial [Crassisporium funariophilum]